MRAPAALLLCATATAAMGDAPDDAAMCRNGLFPAEPPFALAQVTNGAPAHFHDDMEGCPGKGAACRTAERLRGGETVITNRTRGAYSCTFHPTRGGGTAGWVETARLRPLPVDDNPPLATWAGRWSSEGNPRLRIRLSEATLRVDGQAWWPGPKPTRRYPSPHVGEIDGALAVTANRARYEDDNLCEVHFTLLGDLLVAGDNGECGGANVSFSAVYRRIRR